MKKSKEFLTSDDDLSSDAESQKKKKIKINDHEHDTLYKLSKMRFVNVAEFKGKVVVNIREYFYSNGKQLPCKKGISLSIEQWDNLKSHMESIDSELKKHR